MPLIFSELITEKPCWSVLVWVTFLLADTRFLISKSVISELPFVSDIIVTAESTVSSML